MFNKNQKKVIVSMSGGVDSSVAAWLLKQQGYCLEGLFMKNWEEDDNNEYCHAANDLADAQMICDKLKIKLHTMNFSVEYWDSVFEFFLDEYKSGRTPNPDILCNKEIKFKVFLNFAIKELGADYIATGHYVRCIKLNDNIKLLRGIDNKKDQSYFLYTLDQQQLSHCLFPIGEFTKLKVRNIATKLGFSNANKKSSTGICFIGKRKFRKFLSRYILSPPGDILSVNNKLIGHHQGLIYYTLGQRKGLGIGGISNSISSPWYVINKDLCHNQLIVAQGYKNKYLMSKELIANQLHWIDRKPLIKTHKFMAKTRYCHVDIGCLAIPRQHGDLQVKFDLPVLAVTPGQSIVFYIGETCIGGGIIKSYKSLNE